MIVLMHLRLLPKETRDSGRNTPMTRKYLYFFFNQGLDSQKQSLCNTANAATEGLALHSSGEKTLLIISQRAQPVRVSNIPATLFDICRSGRRPGRRAAGGRRAF